MSQLVSLKTIDSFPGNLVVRCLCRIARAGIGRWPAVLCALLCCQAFHANAQDVKEMAPQSCAEVYNLFAAAESDSRGSAELEARLFGKVVKWQTIYHGNSSTLWGMEVTAECAPAGNAAKVSILFDGKARDGIERLWAGGKFGVKGILSGFDRNRGLLLTDAELFSEAIAESRSSASVRTSGPATVSPRTESTGNEQPVTLRPPSPALPSIQPRMEKEIRVFLRGLLDLSENRDWKSVALFYDDKVDYYGAGTVDLKFIEKDRQGFYKKWIQSRYTIGEVEVVDDPAPGGLISVRYIYDFESSSQKESVRGKSENFLKLKRVGKGFRIVSTKEKLLHRERM